MNDRQFVRFAFVLVSIALAIALGCTTGAGGGGGTPSPTPDANDNQSTNNDNTVVDENSNDNTADDNTNDNETDDNLNDNVEPAVDNGNENDNTTDDNTNDNTTDDNANDNVDGGGGGSDTDDGSSTTDFSHLFAATLSGYILDFTELTSYTSSKVDDTPSFAGVTIDSNNDLYVTSQVPVAIYVFQDGLTLGSNPSPVATIEGAATQLDSPGTVALDSTGTRLFVCNAPSQVQVYDDIADPAFDGNIAPDRIIESTQFNYLMDLCFASNGELYVANGYPGNTVLTFSNPTMADGETNPARTISNAAFDNVKAVFIDTADNLYVVTNFKILVYANAASVEGDTDPDRTITVLDSEGTAIDFIDVIVSDAGNGYLTTSTSGGSIIKLDNIATLNGEVTATATLPNTEFAYSLFLVN